MNERPQNPNDSALIERISKLEALVGTLAVEIKKFARWMQDGDRLIIERIRIVERHQEDAFERIKNMELKLFPDLARDIIRLNDIVGDGENKADNPLDRGKP